MITKKKKETPEVEKEKNIREEITSSDGLLASQIEKDTLENDKPNVVTVEQVTWMNKKNIILFISILIVVLALAIAPALYFYKQYRQMQQKLANPTAEAQVQVTALVREVGYLILLPASEVPTIATVSDKSKLAGQQFFAKAEDGDKVLIYPKAGKAYLYRPSMKKIIEVGPVNIDSPDQIDTEVAGASTSATPTVKPISVALYNGTQVSGLTRKAEPSILGLGEGVKVTTKENAAKDTYTETQVVVLSSSALPVGNKIASVVGGTVVLSLPEGESRPSADILVIFGSDYQ